MSPSRERPGPPTDIDPHRFERCFRDHYADVLAFAIRRISDREAAEDAVSETFAVVWRQRNRIPDLPLPWLYAIARRVLANQRRSIHRRQELDKRLANEAGATTPALDPIGAYNLRSTFSNAFAQLTESEREVLRLVAWDGIDPNDAAQVLDCSAIAFRVRLHRARRKLARLLEATGHSRNERRPAAPNPCEEIR